MEFLKLFAVWALAETLSLVCATTTTDANTRFRLSDGSRLPRLLSFSNAVDTTSTFYAEEAQAWRMLGVYMDCEPQEDGTSVCERFLLWAAVRIGYLFMR